MNFFSNVFANLFRFDGLILIVAAANLVVVYPMLRKISKKLNQTLNPTVSRPIEDLIKALQPSAVEKLDLQVIMKQKEKENQLFQIYISITSIFPLLGILGTVIALLSVGDFSANLINLNFGKALTSTFWGLIWAIFFKSLEGFFASTIQQNEENIKLLLHRIDQYAYDKVGGNDEKAVDY